MSVLVDSSVIIDLLTNDERWANWSETRLAELSTEHELCVNDMVWAECSAAFSKIETYHQVMAELRFTHLPMPKEALFLATKAFLQYRRRGGAKTAPLPDFFIGAHAAVSKLILLTRDPRRVKAQFPRLEIISPV